MSLIRVITTIFIFSIHRKQATREGNGSYELQTASQVQLRGTVLVQKWQTDYER